MTESARAVAGPARRIGRDVEDDVIRVSRIAAHAANSGKVIEPEEVADAPGDIVIAARGIAADTNTADNLLARGIQSESAAEDFAADQWIVGRAEAEGRPLICVAGIDRIARLETVETAAGLNGRIEIRGR